MKSINIAIVSAIIISVVLGIVLPFSVFWGPRFNLNTAAGLGSYWSGIGSLLFSGLSLYLIYLTYSSQTEELRQSRDIISDQLSTAKQTRFEQTFFSQVQSLDASIGRLDPTTSIGWFTFDFDGNYLKTEDSAERFRSYFVVFRSSELERMTLLVIVIVEYIFLHGKEGETTYRDFLKATLPLSVKEALVYQLAFSCASPPLAERAKRWYDLNFLEHSVVNKLPYKYIRAIHDGEPVLT